MFIIEQQCDPFRPVWKRLGEYPAFEDALKDVRGDANHRIVNSETGETTLARSRYGGGLETSTDNGATWRRIKRPGATPVIGLGINTRGLERGWYARHPNPDEFIHNPSVDVIADLAKRGAAINAANKR